MKEPKFSASKEVRRKVIVRSPRVSSWTVQLPPTTRGSQRKSEGEAGRSGLPGLDPGAFSFVPGAHCSPCGLLHLHLIGMGLLLVGLQLLGVKKLLLDPVRLAVKTHVLLLLGRDTRLPLVFSWRLRVGTSQKVSPQSSHL